MTPRAILLTATATALILSALTFAAPTVAFAKTPRGVRLADERVLLRTNRGDLVIALYPDVAPAHVEQILKLVRLGAYDSTWFPRIEPNFLIQLTTAQGRRLPLAPEQQAAIRKLPAEFSTLRHRPGTVSMARLDNDPNSAETSFSILLARSPHLDGKYTIIGDLEWGSAVLSAIAMTPRDGMGKPLEEVLVEKAEVKTADEIFQLRAAGKLQQVVPAAQAAMWARRSSFDPVVAGGLSLMIVLSLLGFLLSGRLQPSRVNAFSLLTVLTGAFFLIRESVPHARGNGLLATALFFGMVALFKLMNRLEGARPSAAAAAPKAPPSPAAATPAGAG